MDSITTQPIPGGWAEREIRVGPRRFSLVVPADPHAFLESPDLEREGALEPYWAQLWTAAQPTAETVLKSNWQPGTPALELGCGIGLVGLAALACGLHVTFSDYHPMAVALALENARRNGFSSGERAATIAESQRPAASLVRAERAIGDQSPRVQGWVFDWRDSVGRQFPIILASDILYDAGNHPALVDLLERVLAPGGICWIGDAGRYHAGRFQALAESRGFDVRLVDEVGAQLPATRAGKYQRFVVQRPPKN